MKLVAFAGGTGSAKLLRGLMRLDADVTVVANVGDNIWKYGVYVCPDIDIACYSLAGISDREKGWGIEGDTFEVLSALRSLGEDTWFKLGDRDLATCLRRTALLRAGKSLTEATIEEARALGLSCKVLPSTDSPLETRIRTPTGDLHLQEFWVRDKGAPRVVGVSYRGASRAALPEAVASAVRGADRIVLCPANPMTSIGPMLSVPKMVNLLSKVKAPIAALSPMAGGRPFSGPAGKFMLAAGISPDSAGVAKLYARFLDSLIIAEEDSGLRRKIESLGVRCIAADTRIRGPEDELRLARELVRA